MRRVLLHTGAGLALWWALAPAPAAGLGPPSTHAELSTSTPAAGAVLAVAPGEVVLTFSRDIEPPPAVAVTGPDGDPVVSGPAVVAGPRVTLPVGAGGRGTYLVGYRAMSVDGHTIEGSFRFSVGAPGPAPLPGDGEPAAGPGWLLPGVGVVVLGAGGWWWRRRSRLR